MTTQTLKANIQDDGLMQGIADLPRTVPSYPKDIIKEMKNEVLKLTDLEKDVLINGIAGSGFYDCDYDEVWSDCIVDTCKFTTKDQVSGVIASLVKKGTCGDIQYRHIRCRREIHPAGIKSTRTDRVLT